jgi:anti-anti-sigma factor
VSDLAQLRVETQGEVTVAHVQGEIDLSNAEEILELILESAVERSGAGLVVELSSVSYIDSAGIRVLFELVDALDALGRPVRVVVPEESSITRILALANASHVVGLDPSLESALARLR